MSDEQRDFDLGDILSVTTGKLVSPRHIAGVYDILNFMTGESLFTHQLPRVGREASPVLLAQHPQLADIDHSSVGPGKWEAWLAEQVAKYGAKLPVRPMNIDQHERIDPMSEAAEIFPPDKIVVVRS